VLSLVLGIDALGYKYFKRFAEKELEVLSRFPCRKLVQDHPAWSPRMWVLYFSGADLRWYGKYVVPLDDSNWRLVRREELPVKFVWDYDPNIVVVNVPVVLPPICRNTGFRPVCSGVPVTPSECIKEINGVKHAVKNGLARTGKVCAVFTWVDRMVHIHWYDETIRNLLRYFNVALREILSVAKRWIIVSDHDMRVKDLSSNVKVEQRRDIPFLRNISYPKAEHDLDPIFISNMPFEVKSIYDVFGVVKKLMLQ